MGKLQTTHVRARIVGLIDHAGEAAQELEHEGEE
jgi:hypothetical protein